MTETAELRKRLEALEGGGDSGGSRKRPVLLLGTLGVTGMAVLLAVIALMSREPQPEPMETAAPAEFQDSGPGFGALDPVAPPEPTPQPAAPASTNAETEALRAQLDEMRAELSALRNAPAPDVPALDSAALDALNAEIDALRSDGQRRRPPCVRILMNVCGKSSACRPIWSWRNSKPQPPHASPDPRPKTCGCKS